MFSKGDDAMIVLGYDLLNNVVVPAIRLIAACILGGIIGYERENTNRPAGFRTHILVCVGSALVMITSEFLVERFSGVVNLDPQRMGAQVISGIGFLGAGTIIRNRFSVKGLTTAASLWAVSCVGLAIGTGFYEGAILATLLIYITLILLKKFETKVAMKKGKMVIIVKGEDRPGQIGDIGRVFEDHHVSIQNIDILNDDDEDEGKITVRFLVRVPKDINVKRLYDDLSYVKGIDRVLDS